MKPSFYLIFIMITCSTIPSSFSQVVIPLYEKEIPNSIPAANQEQSVTDGILRITKVSLPSITMYPAPAGKGKVPAVVICPGGGYGMLAAGHEGSDVARRFNEMGITAFVLKYRLPDDRIMIDRSIGPLQDAQRAVQLVRLHADKWNVNANQVGIMGFSAGGHLASTAGTHFNWPQIPMVDGISLRPDFMILIYPVISFRDSITHSGSRNNLIGKDPNPEKIKNFSNEMQVTTTTPPTFLVHAKDDEAVPVENTYNFENAMKQKGVPVEVYLYEAGGHGFGMVNKTSNVLWMDLLEQWLTTMKFL